MQKNILALIMYRRLLITTEINNPINHNNVCIECIFLKEGGGINKNQQLRFYHVRDVVSYITRKQDNLRVYEINTG